MWPEDLVGLGEKQNTREDDKVGDWDREPIKGLEYLLLGHQGEKVGKVWLNGGTHA